jgi:methionyl-tRNA synthetase
MISYDDFTKVEMKVGKILSAEPVPKSSKLLKLSVSFGFVEKVETPVVSSEPVVGEAMPVVSRTEEVRQIVSGIAKYFPDIQVLVGKKCMFVTNLEPRPLMGLESNGMILAVSTEDGKFSLLEPNDSIPEGTKVK